MNKDQLNKKVLSYKDYVVFKTEDNCFEVWDYTFKTPTTWLCGIVETLEETKPTITSIPFLKRFKYHLFYNLLL